MDVSTLSFRIILHYCKCCVVELILTMIYTCLAKALIFLDECASVKVTKLSQITWFTVVEEQIRHGP